MSLRHVCKTYLSHVLKTSWGHAFKTSSRCLADKKWGYVYLTNLNAYVCKKSLFHKSIVQCFSAKSEQVISGPWFNMLMLFRNSNLNRYHLGRVDSKYALRILSCKSLDWTMDATHQEKEILTSEGDYKTGSNGHYSHETKMVKGPSCEVNCNLQLDQCTVWEAVKWKSSTLCLVYSTRYPRLTQLRKSHCSCYCAFLVWWQVFRSLGTGRFIALLACMWIRAKDLRLMKAYYL